MKVLYVTEDGDCGQIDEKDLGSEDYSLQSIWNGELDVFRFNTSVERFEQASVDEAEEDEEKPGEDVRLELSWHLV